MSPIRPYRAGELPLMLQRGTETSRAQLVRRELPGATAEGVATQLLGMYLMALQVPDSTILVADLPAGGMGGYALLMPQANPFTGERELVVMDIFTEPAARGTGWGRMLLQEAATYARRIGAPSLVAQVALHNESSLRLFQRSGFQGERVVLGRRLD